VIRLSRALTQYVRNTSSKECNLPDLKMLGFQKSETLFLLSSASELSRAHFRNSKRSLKIKIIYNAVIGSAIIAMSANFTSIFQNDRRAKIFFCFRAFDFNKN